MERIGIDIGATLTKVKDGGRLYRLATGDALATVRQIIGGRKLEVHVTGCRAMELPERIGGSKIIKIPEFEALANGARVLTDLSDGVMATVGTGTSIIRISDGEHLGGTGVGGGTLRGLANLMLDVSDSEALEELAHGGDPAKVNLLVGDICPLPPGHLLSNVTASNFARVLRTHDHTRADIAAGLYSLVGEVVATAASFIARKEGFDFVLYSGGGMVDSSLRAVIERTTVFWGLKLIVVPEPLFVGAIGAYNRGR